MSPQQQLHLIERRLEANRGGIVLFHDTRKQTAAMLPGFIQFLRKGGYRLVHVVPAKP
jgi:peptidoglycan/xylan/chitin deacetylase (PgdA/CDA1 family)